MKKILIILLFIFSLFTNVFSQQYWLNMGRVANQNLWKCCFTDTLNGWAVGDSGLIIHTSNGGANWSVQESNIREYMVSISFLNKRLGWALGWSMNNNYYGTIILRTTNGGINWDTSAFPIPDTYVRTIYFQDSLNGFMGGGPAVLLKTSNGGINWTNCSIDTNAIASRFPISRFKFYSQNFGLGLGGVMDIAGVFWTTTNRGEYWSVNIVAPEPIVDVKYFDNQNILAIGGDYEYGLSILRTTNGGQNWSYKNMGIFGVPYTLSFRNESQGWVAMGYLPKFFVTQDCGLTWYEYDTPDSARIFDISFLNDKFGVGVGTNGTFIKFNNASVNINNNSGYLSEYNLKQNYPNPFNPSTNIEYELSDISNVELKIFNMTGQEVQTLYKGIKPAGNYTAKFNGSSLPTGIYFYNLKVVNIKTGISNVITKKMVLIK